MIFCNIRVNTQHNGIIRRYCGAGILIRKNDTDTGCVDALCPYRLMGMNGSAKDPRYLLHRLQLAQSAGEQPKEPSEKAEMWKWQSSRV